MLLLKYCCSSQKHILNNFQMYVLYVLSFMIEHAGSEINPLVGALSSYLPALWQECEEHNMLRCAIISTLVHLEKVHIFYIV